MVINKDTSISNGDESISLFLLIKSALDLIDNKEEFEAFKAQVNYSLGGCLEYINCMSFTDKSILVDKHQKK